MSAFDVEFMTVSSYITCQQINIYINTCLHIYTYIYIHTHIHTYNVANNSWSSVFTDRLRPLIGNFVSKFHEDDRPILLYRAKNN